MRRLEGQLVEDAARALVTGAPDSPRAAVLRLSTAEDTVAAAAGAADPDSVFHIASIGKLFTAAMVHQLDEEGSLGPAGVDATLGDIGCFEAALLDRLHVRDRPRGAEITVAQLLSHTSGLCDVFNDDRDGLAIVHGRPAPRGLSARFFRALRALASGDAAAGALAARQWRLWDPDHPEEPEAGLLNAYVAELGATPVGLPGERFHYSDQGYQLLALLIERLDGRPYGEAQRRRLIDPLGLRATWMFGREPPPDAAAGDPLEVFLSGLPVFAHGANLSFDYGGGGQVSTTRDLTTLLDALRAGRVFSSPRTAGRMWDVFEPPGLMPPRTGVALGPQRWVSRFSGAPMAGHAGAWGAHLWWDARTGATVAGCVNQRDDSGYAFRLLDAFACGEPSDLETRR